MRLFVVFSLAGVVAAAAACTEESDSPLEVWRLRNWGRLQAARDVQEGYNAAAEAFLRLCDLRPDPLDLLNLARVQVLGLHFDEARAALLRARGAWPNAKEIPVDFAYLEGLALKGQSRYKEAAERFREVTISDPSLEVGWFQLGTCLSYAQAHSDSILAYDKLLELNPRHLAAHYKRSMALRALKETARADEALARFNELKRLAGEAAADDSAYERCKYTKVTAVPPVGAGPKFLGVEVRMEDFTASAGLAGLDALGAVTIDYDRDGDSDLYLVRNGPNRLLRNDAGQFIDVSEVTDAAEAGEGVTAEPADFNNDGLADIFVVNRKPACVLLKGLGEGVFQPLPRSGLALNGVEAAKWADYDHDGDLDLMTLEASSRKKGKLEPSVHRNNGDETFLRQEGLLGGAVSGRSIAVGDFDRGNDIDFVLGSKDGPVVVCMNLRKGPFRCVPQAGFRRHELVACADLNGDGELDLIGAAGGEGPLEWALQQGPQVPGEVPAFKTFALALNAAQGPMTSLGAVDLDNDGVPEIVAAGPGGVIVATVASEPTGGAVRPIEATAGMGALTISDVNGDGALDILGFEPQGSLRLMRNVSRVYPAVTLQLVGSRDNKDGVGSHVELFAGFHYQRRLVQVSGVTGGTSAVRFGLGATAIDSLDGFEILWPNGISQPLLPGDLKWGPGNRLEVTQKRGLTVSCPFLFVHDGSSYRFQADVVGIAPLDEWLPQGGRPHLDPEEYVRIPGDHLRAVGGRLRLAITEELRETTYLDRVRLLRLTHPRGTVVFGDETTRQGELDPLRIWVVPREALRTPRSVRNGQGHSFDAEIAPKDGRYAHPYPDSPTHWAGWVEEHSLEIEPPEGLSGGSLLLLEGRIYWPDSSVNFALSQHERAWIPPRLDAVFSDGSTVTLLADIGFPCGMDRSMVLPLDLPCGRVVRSLRIVTNHRFLWDRIGFATESVRVELTSAGKREVLLTHRRWPLDLEALPMCLARLEFHGFSRVVGNMEKHEQTYEFPGTTPAVRFQYPTGRATAYGDVLDLVLEPDSRLVVIPPGDALFSEFEAGAKVVDAAETYFLQVTGWAKENNFHNWTGRFLGPLPFHGMDGYPPPIASEAPSPLTRTVRGD